MDFAELKNESESEFTSIESEKYRIYRYESQYHLGYFFEVTIQRPVAISVSSSGGHRVADADGKCHYIPWGWRHLYWEPKEGQNHFVK